MNAPVWKHPMKTLSLVLSVVNSLIWAGMSLLGYSIVNAASGATPQLTTSPESIQFYEIQPIVASILCINLVTIAYLCRDRGIWANGIVIFLNLILFLRLAGFLFFYTGGM